MNPVYEICDLPREWWGDAETDNQCARVAVDHLMSCLGRIRGLQYEFLDQPDQNSRRSRAPDYRYGCRATGDIVAVEYKRFVDPEQREAMSLLRQGRRFRPKGRMRPVEHEGEQFGSISIGEPNAEVRQLRDFIVQAIGYGQLQAVHANERILLILDARLVYLSFLTATDFSFAQSERDAIDHVFLLRPGSVGHEPTPSKILQVW
jgi:hypothetical protein